MLDLKGPLTYAALGRLDLKALLTYPYSGMNGDFLDLLARTGTANLRVSSCFLGLRVFTGFELKGLRPKTPNADPENI